MRRRVHVLLGPGSSSGRIAFRCVRVRFVSFGVQCRRPALGYLAQVDYALLAALECMDDEDDFAVSIEPLDDIVYHDADSDDATETWQSKHTINQTRSLSDASSDLWKTLANWIAEPGEFQRGRWCFSRSPMRVRPLRYFGLEPIATSLARRSDTARSSSGCTSAIGSTPSKTSTRCRRPRARFWREGEKGGVVGGVAGAR